MAFLEKIPSWLRWILFLPLALIAYFLCLSVFLLVIFQSTGEGLLWQGFLLVLAKGPSTFVFVWVGARVAPRAQFKISISLAVLFGLFSLFVIGDIYLELESTLVRRHIAGFGVGLIGAVAASYLFYRNYKKGKPQDTEYEVIELPDLEE
jgi:hypothetical protein